MKDFKVGDRYLVGKKSILENGNVIEITSVRDWGIGYKTVKPESFHVSRASFETGSTFSNDLELFEENFAPIIIYRKGSEVIALDKSNGEKGIAKCCPTDTFDFRIGAKLAFERLLGVDKTEVREVKRKAKVGEWVKVLHTSYFGEIKKTPYITQCVEIMRNGNKLARLKGVGIDNKDTLGFCENEYVVLENYQPPKEEEKEPGFEKGKRYIFDKDTYDPDDGCEGSWASQCDGKKVIVQSKTRGLIFVNGTKFVIHPKWCIEMVEEKPKFYNGKVVCVSDGDDFKEFTKGKTYEVVDGIIIGDSRDTWPMAQPISSFEDLEEYFRNKEERSGKRTGYFNGASKVTFIEVVE